MLARVSKFEGSSEKLDELVELFEQELLPNFEAQPGFKGVTFLVDRENGRALGTTFWESEADLRASEEMAHQQRQRAAGAITSEIEPTREVYQVAVRV
jgi:heme-degrading monooxygenase HmoA